MLSNAWGRRRSGHVKITGLWAPMYSKLIETIFFLLCCGGCFLFGWVFFQRKIFKNYEIKDSKIQLFFSLSLTLSCIFFILIMCEIFNVMDTWLRFVFWKLSLHCMLVLQILIIPFYQLHTWLFSFLCVKRKYSLALSGLLMLVWLFAFYRIGESFPVVVKEHGLFSVEMSVSRVSGELNFLPWLPSLISL